MRTSLRFRCAVLASSCLGSLAFGLAATADASFDDLEEETTSTSSPSNSPVGSTTTSVPVPVVLQEPFARPFDAVEIPGTAVEDIEAHVDQGRVSTEPHPGAVPLGLVDALALQAPLEARLGDALDAVARADEAVGAATSSHATARTDLGIAEKRLERERSALRDAEHVRSLDRTLLREAVADALVDGRSIQQLPEEFRGTRSLVHEARLRYLDTLTTELAERSARSGAAQVTRRRAALHAQLHRQALEADLVEAREQLEQARKDQAAATNEVREAAGGLLALTGSVVPGVRDRVMDAYVRAAQLSALDDSRCGMTWWALASIGRVESGHAAGRNVAAGGQVEPAILGPRLTGSGGFARIADTDDGRLDGDTELDRAVGPMQFIPSTWATSGVDASGDGIADPHNLYDAAYAAARYLCAASGGLRVDTEAGFRRAAFSYNHSLRYVDMVWTGGSVYREIAAAAAGPTT